MDKHIMQMYNLSNVANCTRKYKCDKLSKKKNDLFIYLLYDLIYTLKIPNCIFLN